MRRPPRWTAIAIAVGALSVLLLHSVGPAIEPLVIGVMAGFTGASIATAVERWLKR